MIVTSNSETWKGVNGFEGLYEVSSEGRVRSLDREVVNKNGFSKIVKGRVLTPSKHTSLYLTIRLCYGNRVYKSYYLHRLIAEHFCGNDNPDSKTQVNHINSDHKDNRACNLEWCTPSENIQHGVSAGKVNNVKVGRKYNRFTKNDAKNIAILEHKGYSINEIAKALGRSRTSISSFINGRAAFEMLMIYRETKINLK